MSHHHYHHHYHMRRRRHILYKGTTETDIVFVKCLCQNTYIKPTVYVCFCVFKCLSYPATALKMFAVYEQYNAEKSV